MDEIIDPQKSIFLTLPPTSFILNSLDHIHYCVCLPLQWNLTSSHADIFRQKGPSFVITHLINQRVYLL